MDTEKDTYKTITRNSKELLFKEKSSKFFGYAFPVKSEDDVKEQLQILQKKHHTAGHFCYAWQLGKSYESYRANDDGEPSNSAGMPIYGQLQSYDVTNILVVVVRYFGGTKLGVGGLIQAYKTTAQMTLDTCKIVVRTINITFKITFEYPEMNSVMRIIKDENLKIVAQKMELACEMQLAVRKTDSEKVLELFRNTYKINLVETEADKNK